jgi:integrating conjugative element protein (TIGR03757 family)
MWTGPLRATRRKTDKGSDMSIRHLLRLSASCLLLLSSGLVLADNRTGPDLYHSITKVEVFANSAMVITPIQANQYQLVIYRLDALKNVEAAINQNIPKTEKEAKAYFAAHQAEIKRQITPAVLNGANGIAMARHYKLDRIPAVVVDGTSVIYGVTNVDQAIAMVQQHRAKNHEEAR